MRYLEIQHIPRPKAILLVLTPPMIDDPFNTRKALLKLLGLPTKKRQTNFEPSIAESQSPRLLASSACNV